MPVSSDLHELRCFVSVRIPDQLKENILLAGREPNLQGVKLIERDSLHITLKFLGNVKPSMLEGVVSILRAIEFSPFIVKLKGFGVFPSEEYIRVVWIGCESRGLYDLDKKINLALADIFRKEEFTAHLTIARVKRKVDLHKFLEQHKNDSFGEFVCSSFELMQSKLTSAGPSYSVLAEFAAKPAKVNI